MSMEHNHLLIRPAWLLLALTCFLTVELRLWLTPPNQTGPNEQRGEKKENGISEASHIVQLSRSPRTLEISALTLVHHSKLE